MAEEFVDNESKNGKGKSLLIIIIVAVLVLLLIVGGLIAFLIMGDQDMPPTNPTATAQIHSVVTQKAPAAQPGRRSADFMNMGVIYPLDQFIVNLLSENGSRFLKAKIDLEQSIEALTPELDKKKALLRDIIIRTLSAKTYEEISTTKGKDRLKDEIVSRINEVLSDGYIKNIFFTDFIIQ